METFTLHLNRDRGKWPFSGPEPVLGSVFQLQFNGFKVSSPGPEQSQCDYTIIHFHVLSFNVVGDKREKPMTQKVVISHVISPGHFYLQLVQDSGDLEE